SVEGTKALTAGGRGIGGLGLGEGSLVVAGDDGVDDGIDLVDAFEMRFQGLSGGDVLRRDPGREFAGRAPQQFVIDHVTSRPCSAPRPARRGGPSTVWSRCRRGRRTASGFLPAVRRRRIRRGSSRRRTS